MKILSNYEFSQKGKLIQQKIFSSFFLFSSPTIFTNAITEKVIIFDYEEVNGYTLSRELTDAVFYAAKNVGDKGIFVSILTSENYSDDTDPIHWYLDLSEKEQYLHLIWGPLENVILSENGTWGVFLSFEGIGVIGGTKEFMSHLRSKAPDIDNPLIRFLTYWKDYEQEQNILTTWIPPLLTHIYGEEKCKELLKEIGTNFDQIGVGFF
jgi:hypothetical protein